MLTERDIESVQLMDYKLNRPVNLTKELINRYFQGMDLLTLLTESEKLPAVYTQPPPYKLIVIDEPPGPTLQIIYLSANYQDVMEGLTLKRTFEFENDDLIVKHDYLVIPKKARGKGSARKLLGIWFDQYMNMGVKQIHVHAGLKDGGLVWAKMGFNARFRNEMQQLLRFAEIKLAGKPELNDVKAIFDAYYSQEPDGKAFPIKYWAYIEEMEPILKNTRNNWHGWIDLTNSEELRNFKANVSR
jgi:hypothetical protein